MLILFDIDGTLLDETAAERAGAAVLHACADPTRPLDEFVAAWDAALDTHFERYLRGEVDFQGQRRARIRSLLGDSLDDAAADGLFDVYLGAYESAWSLYRDAVPCLDALAGHRLGVVSNGRGAQQRRKLERTGIADRFDCIVISEEVGRRKPDAGIFIHACAAVGTAPEEAIYVGDRYDTDALGARQAGLAGVWLDRDGRLTDQHESPVVAAFDEFTGLVTSRDSA